MASMNARRIRLAIVVAGAVIGLIARNVTRASEFERNFDLNISRHPLASSLAQRDPELRKVMLRETETAYNKGGWRGAQAALEIVLGTLQVYADDAQVIAIKSATLRVLYRLRATPADCKAFLLTGARRDDFPNARPELSELADAERVAIANGFERKSRGLTWRPPRDDVFFRDDRSLSDRPQPLSRAEIQALEDYTDGDATQYCNGSIRQLENLLSRPPSEAARIARDKIDRVRHTDWVKVAKTVCREQQGQSGGMVCSTALPRDTEH
ncbi:MAG: hypothetical protein JO000_23025 [Alphaproteobacteria bacterium]|nr:hypothetical protein [Alphaproteobacteria bacterium]